MGDVYRIAFGAHGRASPSGLRTVAFDRLGLGGVDDKVWRAALRFSLDALAPGALIVTAELSLWYDKTCVAPRRTSRPCCDLVAEWQSGGSPNNGVLLKLADGEEDFDSGGPYFPSSSYATPELHPRLTIWYLPP